MASYHLNVKTISRSQGRSSTAAAAYRSAERIVCERYGVEHDYTRKGGVVHTEILAPDGVSDWIADRAGLWNAVEATETRKNSVVAREWEVALPSELSDAARQELVHDFAFELVERYGVVADVAIHAPHREGDQRNHHAHILTTTRRAGADGFGEKTRELDVKKTSSVEVSTMRATWADLQNAALERNGEDERVDHRSLEAQREEAERTAREAEERGREEEALRLRLVAEALHREPEPKLGPRTSAIERRAKQEAEREGVAYIPVTERGAEVAHRRAERSLFEEVRERFDAARDTYTAERERGQGRRGAATSALRALVEKERAREALKGAEREAEQRAAQERIEARKREEARLVREKAEAQRVAEELRTQEAAAHVAREEAFRRARERAKDPRSDAEIARDARLIEDIREQTKRQREEDKLDRGRGRSR